MRWLLALALITSLLGQTPAHAQSGNTPRAPSAVNSTLSISFVENALRAPVGYQPVRGRVVFKARVAGREVWALLDNGAGQSLIDLGLAEEAGLELFSRGTVVGAGGGRLASQRVSNVPVTIPGQIDARLPMLALDMSAAQEILGYPIQFVLGEDILSQIAVRVHPGERNFELAPSGTLAVPEGTPSIPLRGTAPLLTVQIEGRPSTVAIDMGSNGGLTLSPAAWARLGQPGERSGTATATGASGNSYQVNTVRFDQIGIGHLSVNDVSASIEAPRPGSGDGVLGMAVLARYVIVMDIRAGKLWLVPFERRGVKGLEN